RREDVADDGAVGETVAHHTAERGVVARSAADHHRDLAWGGFGGADHAAGDADDVLRIGVEESGEHVLGEGGRVVEQACHVSVPSVNVAAAVDINGGSGQIGGVLTGQESDHGGDLLGGRGASYRDVGGQLGLLFVGGADPDVGVDGTGRDGVHGD